jgi:hypothetical protein|tara:strand:- start:127 stop:1209 length:1083 start_codon:yes stop_codon:yes gene_type:complete
MSSLLEEAIVDAKALKEAALKNAENAVLEKYSTEVKGALATLLEQEEDAAPVQEADEDLMEFAEELPFAFQNEELDAPEQGEIVEIDFDALKQRIAEEDEIVESDDLIDATELAEEIVDEAAGSDYMTQDEDDAEEAAAVAASGGGTAGMPLDEDEDIAFTEEMLAELVEELVVDMVPRPQGWSSINSANNSIEQANNDAMGAAQAAHLEEEEIEEEVATAPDVVSDAALYEAKISDITESNRELRALIMEAKSQLTQLNLANAKLVYQNKALNSASLNERQKNQLVEAVQTATSVEEASMIFETIQNAVGSSPDQRTRPQTLREAVQRPASLLINSKKNNTATKDPNMDRMLRLAGLNK